MKAMTKDQAHLVMDNMRLVSYIAIQYKGKCIEMEDLISVGKIGLIKAAITYSSDKSASFGTYAGTCIRNEIFMELRKRMNKPEMCSIDSPVAMENDKGDSELRLIDMLAAAGDDVSKDIEDRSDKRELYRAIQMLPEKERRLISLRYLMGWSQERVGMSFHHTQSYISRMEAKALRMLRELLADAV